MAVKMAAQLRPNLLSALTQPLMNLFCSNLNFINRINYGKMNIIFFQNNGKEGSPKILICCNPAIYELIWLKLKTYEKNIVYIFLFCFPRDNQTTAG